MKRESKRNPKKDRNEAAKASETQNTQTTVSWGKMASHMFSKLLTMDKGLIGLCLIYTVATAIYPLLSVYLPGLLIAQLEAAEMTGLLWNGGNVPDALLPMFRNLAVILSAFLILAGTLGYISQYLSNRSYARISYLRLDYIRDFVRKVMTMDFYHYEDASFLDRQRRSNRAIQGNQFGVEVVYRNSFMLPAMVLSAVFMVVVLAVASPWLIVLPIATFISLIFTMDMGDRFRFSLREETGQAERRLRYYSQITQDFSYGKDIRLYSLNHTIFSAYGDMIDRMLSLVKRIQQRSFTLSMIPSSFHMLTMLICLLILSLQTYNGRITVAQFAIYLQATVSLSQVLDQMAEMLITTVSEGRYVREFIEHIDEDLNQFSGNQTIDDKAPIVIEFDAVSFSYPGSEKTVIDNLSFRIDAGERLALVGINGAGKSTIVKLMTGLHHPTSGRILINGTDTRELDTNDLFKKFSVVFQEDESMAFTVAEVVSGGARDIDRSRVRDALERLGLWEKVTADTDGMDRMMLKVIDPEGFMFSGGETQKLMLSRAIYKDAPVVILDEPTSALDALAETKVYQDFSNVMTDKTSLFISHRLASTSFCDRIILLSGGQILESGTHAELMANRSDYYNMFVTQGKYYQDNDAAESVVMAAEADSNELQEGTSHA